MIKKVHRKCMMKGCRSTTSYHISLSREIGNSIIICHDCAQKALDMIDEFENRNMPPAVEEAAKLPSPASANTADSEAHTEAVYTCPECGKAFNSEKGLATHKRIHKE